MEKIQTQEREDDTEPVDAFASVMGPEHSRFVRLYGRGVNKTTLKEKVGDPAPSGNLLQQKMKKIEERMKQRMLEIFEEQNDTMQQQIAINIIARLQRLNPDLQLDPDLLVFCAGSCTSGETKGGENEEANDEHIEDR
ncbi:hypothetical protein FXO37_08794 [Capsicum annuum]|nr:hypothetical protein FXO37_08794 [Capsicum annuum]